MSNRLQEFPTGLFLDQEKCDILLNIVQDILRNKYHLYAVTGPHLPNDTCEILLRSLDTNHSGANLADAQVLLAKYLDMTKESRPKMVAEKDPELIDLDASDDEPMDEHSVIIVDLDESDTSSKTPNCEGSLSLGNTPSTVTKDSLDKQTSLSKSHKNNLIREVKGVASVNVVNSDILVVDSVKKHKFSPKLSSPKSSQSRKDSTALVNLEDSDIIFVDSVPKQSSPKTPHSSTDTGGVLKDSNNQNQKKGLAGEMAELVDVVDLLDDEVIILDDSYTASNSSKAHSSLSEDSVAKSKSLPIEQTVPLSEVSSSSGTKNIRSDNNRVSGSYSNTSHSDASEKPAGHESETQIKENKRDDNVEESQNSGPPKKKSKLTYHRPAHLVTPLTKPSAPVPSTNIDSASNIYNPNADSSEKRTGPRPIVIDGNNVAISHGKGSFSLKGIQICINYFEKRGHRQIKVFIPHYRKNRENFDELLKMEKKGLLVTTPSRKVNGKVLASYDDRYIVQYAAEFGGVIISTDNFRDLLSENPSWTETIENRLLMFTWVDDLLMFPQDPLGREGPSLDEFLKFPDT